MGRRPEPLEVSRARQEDAFRLRMAGVSYAEIARMVGYSNLTSAHSAVKAVISRLPNHVDKEELRKLELERLDSLQVNVWRSAQAGSLKAVETYLKLSASRSDLTGIRAPVSMEIGGPEGGPIKVTEVTIVLPPDDVQDK